MVLRPSRFRAEPSHAAGPGAAVRACPRWQHCSFTALGELPVKTPSYGWVSGVRRACAMLPVFLTSRTDTARADWFPAWIASRCMAPKQSLCLRLVARPTCKEAVLRRLRQCRCGSQLKCEGSRLGKAQFSSVRLPSSAQPDS